MRTTVLASASAVFSISHAPKKTPGRTPRPTTTAAARSDFKLLTGYVRRSLKILTRHPRSSSLRGLIRDFQPWRRSLANKTTPAQEGLPWLTFGAIRFLDGWLKPGMRVFEYGCGGSTIFLAARVKEVVSVEHDEGWARRVVQQFERSSQTLPQILKLTLGRSPAGERR